MDTKHLHTHIVSEPCDYNAYAYLGVLLSDEGLKEECLSAFKRCIKLQPNISGAWINLATFAIKNDLHFISFQSMRMFLALFPNDAEGYNIMGNTISAKSHSPSTSLGYREALLINPLCPRACNGYANQLRACEKSELADFYYKLCIILSPCREEPYLNIVAGCHDINESKKILRHAITLAGIKEIAICAIAGVYLRAGIISYSIKAYKAAVSIYPSSIGGYNGLGACFVYDKKYNNAKNEILRALSISPSDAVALKNHQLMLLITGNLRDGFKQGARLSETRGRSVEIRECCRIDSSRTLTLYFEEGIGDQVLAVSALKALDRVSLKTKAVVDNKLIPIFARSFPGIDFLSYASNETNFDESGYHVHISRLCAAQWPNIKSLAESRVDSYLEIAGAHHQTIRNMALNNGFIVCGISWSSSRDVIGEKKTLNLDNFHEIFIMDRVVFVNLQHGDSRKALRDIFEYPNQASKLYYEPCNITNDIDSLCDAISICDIVLSASNSTAHLAGAVGVETFVFIPESGQERLWYWWNISQSRSLWYPKVRVLSKEKSRSYITAKQRIEQIRSLVRAQPS